MRATSNRPITTPAYTDAIERFIDRLATFQPADWIAVATAVDRNAAAHIAACARVTEIVRSRGLQVDAWFVLDAIQTTAHARGPDDWPSGRALREAARSRVARRAADLAALALLVRSHLDAESFDVLHAPFCAPGPRLVRGNPGPDHRDDVGASAGGSAPATGSAGGAQCEPRLSGWRKLIFRALSRLEQSRGDTYGLPADRVRYVELPVDLSS